MSGWDDTQASGNWESGKTSWDPPADSNKDASFAPENDLPHDSGVDAGDRGLFQCRNCGEEGHKGVDCPQPKQLKGECYNCGQVGHNKADCTNPRVERPFTGTCRHCNETGHRAAECPNKPPEICRNCGKEGHRAADCDQGRQIDLSKVADVTEPEAMRQLYLAADKRDTDLFQEGVKMLLKGQPSLTYVAIEKKLRAASLGCYLVALEREVPLNFTNVDLQGKQGRTYTVKYSFSPRPRRQANVAGYPATPEDNVKRLEDAGEQMPNLKPVCRRCGELGHTTKFCKQEAMPKTQEVSKYECPNCKELGHYLRDCPNPRQDRNACRNCGQSGHKAADCTEPRSMDNVECRACGETGHMSRDCPSKPQRDNTCRNCGQEGHMSRDCDQPRNPATMTCRNCDEVGHMSKECPKPRDWSRVKCNQCGEMGHTVARCPNPLADNDAGELASHEESGGVSVEAAPAFDDGTTTTGGGW